MNSFISTHGGSPVSLSQALDRGLAPDGGLYVPTRELDLGAPTDVPGRTFADTAQWAARHLVPSVPHQDLAAVVTEALHFDVPLVEVERDLWVLELFHGPTHAFKDVGARFMARLMSRTLASDHERTVLVATSGDTGGAVAAAFHGMSGYRVVVLFPRNGVSERQRRQMTTLGGNVHAMAVDGTFDDCQRLAKEAFLDAELTERFHWTSANSINIGRLLPQALYYVHAARMLGWDRTRPRFVVPCGNLGNLCAGLFAHRAGMPAVGFLAATNANHAFVDFLEHGVHEPRPSVRTASNAMDVGDPSNLERILWLYDEDVDGVRRDVRAEAVSDAETADTIAAVFERTGYVLDPHSAVAYHTAQAAEEGRSAGEPMVVLATAHPAKFPEIVRDAIGKDVPLPPGLARAMELGEEMHSVAPTMEALVEAVGSLHPEAS